MSTSQHANSHRRLMALARRTVYGPPEGAKGLTVSEAHWRERVAWFGDCAEEVLTTAVLHLREINTGERYLGEWRYYQASNGAVFTAPNPPPDFEGFNLRGALRTVSPMAAGVIACLHAYKLGGFADYWRRYIQLFDFANRHWERSSILRAAGLPAKIDPRRLRHPFAFNTYLCLDREITYRVGTWVAGADPHGPRL